MDYRRDIDGLRAIAVSAVVVNHAFPGVLPGGYVGVDVFFVISGFLITTIIARELDEGCFSLVAFYERRARRIFPALFTMLAIVGVLGWFLFPPDIYHAFGKSAVATSAFLSNIWFAHAITGYFGLGAKVEPLLHTWSLGVEEQYYLFIPLLLMFAWRRPSLVQPILWGLVLLSFGMSLIATGTPFHPGKAPIFGFFWLPTRAWELGAGALLAIGAFGTPRRMNHARLAAWTGFTFLLGSMFLLDDESPFPGLLALPACAGTVALLWAGGFGDRGTELNRALGKRALVAIGLISYSLYLWHWPFIVLARVTTTIRDLPISIAFICIFASCIAAWLSWRFVERPFRDRRRIGRTAIFAGTGVAAFALAGFGLVVHMKNGVPQRLPDEVYRVYEEVNQGREFAEHCRAVSKTGQNCILGEQADGVQSNVFVWGDSHAMAMIYGIDEWLRENGMSAQGRVVVSCAALPDSIPGGFDRVEQEFCINITKEIYDWLMEETVPQTVVLISRWRMLRSGEITPNESGVPYIFGTTRKDLQGLEQREVFDALLDKFISDLRSAGHSVVILNSIPEMGVDIPRAYMVAALRQREFESPLTKSMYLERAAETTAALMDVAERHGALLIEPASVLCEESCAVMRNGKLYYYDDDHLSAAASSEVAPLIFEKIDDWSDIPKMERN